jgi:hypothetical protein
MKSRAQAEQRPRFEVTRQEPSSGLETGRPSSMAGPGNYLGRVKRTEKLYPTETGWPW